MNTAVYLNGKADFWKEKVYYPFSGNNVLFLKFSAQHTIIQSVQKVLEFAFSTRGAPSHSIGVSSYTTS